MHASLEKNTNPVVGFRYNKDRFNVGKRNKLLLLINTKLLLLAYKSIRNSTDVHLI